jgi:hypothetical protein
MLVEAEHFAYINFHIWTTSHDQYEIETLPSEVGQ